MKDSLLSSKELWTCYHCGLCSETCPTDADPGAFMAAARRYAIASYDRTKLARTLYTRPVAGSVIAILLAALFAVFMYAAHGPKNSKSLELFTFVPEGLVHWTGVAVMMLMTVAGVAGSRDDGARDRTQGKRTHRVHLARALGPLGRTRARSRSDSAATARTARTTGSPRRCGAAAGSSTRSPSGASSAC